jgi:hypothetical protein
MNASPTAIAYNIHSLFGFLVVHTVTSGVVKQGIPLWHAYGGVVTAWVALTAFKEFYLDPKHEGAGIQSGLTDFIGYRGGDLYAALAIALGV